MFLTTWLEFAFQVLSVKVSVKSNRSIKPFPKSRKAGLSEFHTSTLRLSRKVGRKVCGSKIRTAQPDDNSSTEISNRHFPEAAFWPCRLPRGNTLHNTRVSRTCHTSDLVSGKSYLNYSASASSLIVTGKEFFRGKYRVTLLSINFSTDWSLSNPVQHWMFPHTHKNPGTGTGSHRNYNIQLEVLQE